MKLETYKKIAALLGVMLVIFLPFYVFFQWVLPQIDNDEINTAPAFVGVDNCKACHLPEYTDWVGSHHDLAMDYATDSTVLADFSGVELKSQGRIHRMYRDGEKFMVYTDGEDGRMQDFEVKYVFGFTPLQQYMVEFDRGAPASACPHLEYDRQ
jgi:hypothetical protein